MLVVILLIILLIHVLLLLLRLVVVVLYVMMVGIVFVLILLLLDRPLLFVGIYTRLTDRYEYLRRYRAHEERDVDIRRRTLMRTKVLLRYSGGVRAGVIAEVVRLLNSLRSVTRVAILARLTGQQ